MHWLVRMRVPDHRGDPGLGAVDIDRPQAVVAFLLGLLIGGCQRGQAEGQGEDADQGD